MSERTTYSNNRRGHRDDRWRLLKGFGFWAFLAVASFTFGMLVLSPLINAARGSTSNENGTRSVSAPIPPAPAHSSAPQERAHIQKTQRKAPGPDVSLTLEPDTPITQRQEQTDPIADPNGTTGRDDAAKNRNDNGDATVRDRSEISPTESVERQGDRRHRIRGNGGETSTGTTHSQESQGATRPRRRGRNADEAVAGHSEQTNKSDVQKSEKIDL